MFLTNLSQLFKDEFFHPSLPGLAQRAFPAGAIYLNLVKVKSGSSFGALWLRALSTYFAVDRGSGITL